MNIRSPLVGMIYLILSGITPPLVPISIGYLHTSFDIQTRVLSRDIGPVVFVQYLSYLIGTLLFGLVGMGVNMVSPLLTEYGMRPAMTL